MKLRFLANSLRLRVNQKEVKTLAAGIGLHQQVDFPGNTALFYNLTPVAAAEPQVFFAQGTIQVAVPQTMIDVWAENEDIGLYFTLLTGAEPLSVAVEKDLDCVDGPVSERDPYAFPRAALKEC